MTDLDDKVLILRKLMDYYQEKQDQESPYIDNSGIPPVYPHAQDRVETRSIDHLKRLIEAIPIAGNFTEYCNIILDQICSTTGIQWSDRIPEEADLLRGLQDLIARETEINDSQTSCKITTFIFQGNKPDLHGRFRPHYTNQYFKIFAVNIQLFILRNEEKINIILKNYRGLEGDRNNIVYSAIAVVIWYFLDKDKFRLLNAWENKFESRSKLELLADVFGISLPSS